jgi:hypothetical protein
LGPGPRSLLHTRQILPCCSLPAPLTVKLFFGISKMLPSSCFISSLSTISEQQAVSEVTISQIRNQPQVTCLVVVTHLSGSVSSQAQGLEQHDIAAALPHTRWKDL